MHKTYGQPSRNSSFQSTANVPIAMLKVLGYYAVFTPVSPVLGNLASEYFSVRAGSIGDYIILGVTMVCNLVTEYIFYKYDVFKS